MAATRLRFKTESRGAKSPTKCISTEEMEDEEAVDHQVYGPHRSSFDCQFDVKRIFAKAGALDVFGPSEGISNSVSVHLGA